MNLKSERMDNDSVKIYVSGKIDTTTAESFRNSFGELTADAKNVVLDFKSVNYISSAGLREIVICKKKYKNLRIENLSDFVYNIFLTTGFDKIIPMTLAKDDETTTILEQNNSSAHISFNEFLENLAKSSSRKNAVVYDGKEYSWADIDKMS